MPSASPPDRPPELHALRDAGAPALADPGRIEPMLAFERSRPFSRPGWLFEPKYDGFRLLSFVDAGGVTLRYRRGGDATARFPEIAAALRGLPAGRFAIDGEVVILDRAGRPDFEAMQRRGLGSRPPAAAALPATLFAFDLLWLGGFDLRGLPLLERKRRLRQLVPEEGVVRRVPHVAEDGEGLFAAAVEQGFEGVMAKRADSAYAAGRSRAWLKIKAERTGDFALVGTAPPSPSTFRRPSVLLAARSGSGLRYAGRAAMGGKEWAALRAVAGALTRPTPACLGAPRSAETWFEPLLVGEVRFLCWTESGALRQPVFLRFRPDKTAAEVARHPAGDERSGA